MTASTRYTLNREHNGAKHSIAEKESLFVTEKSLKLEGQ